MNDELNKPLEVINKISFRRKTVVIIAFVLVLILGFYFFKTKESDYVLIGRSFKTFEKYINYFEKPINLTTMSNMTIDGSLNLKADVDDSSLNTMLNELKLDYQLSNFSELNKLEINLKQRDKSLLNAKLYSNKETGYIYLTDIYNKYIEISELKTLNNINQENDYTKLEVIIKNQLLLNFEKKEIIKGNKEITIDSDIINSKYLKIIYTKEEIVELYNNIIDEIKKDKEAYDILKDLYPNIDRYNINELDINKLEYTVYSEGILDNILAISLDVETKEENYFFEYKEQTTPTLIFKSKDEEIKISIIKEINKITFKVIDNNKYYMVYFKSSLNQLELYYEEIINLEKNTNLLTIDFKDIEHNKRYTGNLTMVTKENNKEIMNLNSDFEIKPSVSEIVDFKNSIKYEQLTDEDFEVMTTNLFANLLGSMQ